MWQKASAARNIPSYKPPGSSSNKTREGRVFLQRNGLKMAAVNVDKMSLKEISDLEAKLAKAKSQAREKARSDLKEKIDRLVSGSGFTVAEIYGFAAKGRGRGKSAAKYANPEDRSETWTGRGRKPNWLVARLKKGASMDDFAI
jgi:DNA-binding protein H-NS